MAKDDELPNIAAEQLAVVSGGANPFGDMMPMMMMMMMMRRQQQQQLVAPAPAPSPGDGWIKVS